MSAPGQLPPCSLLVPTRNRRDLLRDTMLSIAAGDLLPAEIVIVDQSDEPDVELPALIAKACAARAAELGDGGPAVRYIASASVGLSRAMNEAIGASSHEFLVCTHDDVRVEPDWLRTLLAAAVAGGADEVVTGRVLPEPGEPGTFVPSTIERTEPAVYDAPQPVYDILFPLNMAMHRSIPRRVGGFDERIGPGTPFPGGEDNEFAYRVLRAGIRIRYVPEAALYHRAWRRLDEFTALRWNYGRGQGAFLAKHATFRDRYGWVRLWRAMYRPVLRLPIRLLRVGPAAFPELANLGGILTAFAQWKWRYRGGSGSAPLSSPGTVPMSSDSGSTT
ncbi:MAG TPA: glycosyltransferase [Longimicrobiales bacterium]|nr:glycosyltransferase [Longimicrobiales bacterium]